MTVSPALSPMKATGSNDCVCSCTSMVRPGLEGVIVSETSVSTVGIPNVGLTYRGYPITQLINGSSYEEVAYLLIANELPSLSQLNTFKSKIAQGRILSLQMKALCELFSHDAHPMDVIRTAVDFHSCDKPNEPESRNIDRAGKLLGLLPSVITYWFNYSTHGKRIDTCAPAEVSVSEHFLNCLNPDIKTSQLSVHSLDKTLIAYAEHDFNASTFSARVTASTLSDYYSCIISAIGTLKGPLHGGANQAALELLLKFDSPKSVPDVLSGMLERKEKVMGFGHRVYKNGDPRHAIMKSLAKRLSECPDTVDRDPELYKIAEVVEDEMISRKKIFPNLDFCASVVYKQLGIPASLFTVLFAIGRTAGWTAHINEQSGANKLIRPKSKYVGSEIRDFVSIL